MIFQAAVCSLAAFPAFQWSPTCRLGLGSHFSTPCTGRETPRTLRTGVTFLLKCIFCRWRAGAPGLHAVPGTVSTLWLRVCVRKAAFFQWGASQMCFFLQLRGAFPVPHLLPGGKWCRKTFCSSPKWAHSWKMSKSTAAEELQPFVKQQPDSFCVFTQLCKSDAEFSRCWSSRTRKFL